MDSGIFGLAAFGFWLFIAAAAVGGIWDGVRKRDAEHETLRRMIESGKEPDRELVDKLLGVAALVTFVGIGLLTAARFLERARNSDEVENRQMFR